MKDVNTRELLKLKCSRWNSSITSYEKICSVQMDFVK